MFATLTRDELSLGLLHPSFLRGQQGVWFWLKFFEVEFGFILMKVLHPVLIEFPRELDQILVVDDTHLFIHEELAD